MKYSISNIVNSRIDGQPFLALNSPGKSDMAKVLRDGKVEQPIKVSYQVKCQGYLAKPKRTDDGTGYQGRSIWDDFDCELLRVGSWAYGREDVEFAHGSMSLDGYDDSSNVKVC